MAGKPLTSRNRLIVDSVINDEMSYRDAAEKLGVSRGIVAGVIRRWREEKGVTGVKDEMSGNERTLTLRGTHIRTLPELIEFMEIDEDQWYLERTTFNFWGNADRPNTQVKVKAINRFPEAIHPVISPLEISVPKLPKVSSNPCEVKSVLYIADAHIGFTKSLRTGKLDPFHDRRALDVALQVAQSVKPDEIVALGDWFDLADWSDKFMRSPSMYWTTQPALAEAAWWLGQFRQCTKKMTMLEGNHGARLPKKIIEHMKEAYGLRKVSEAENYPVMSLPFLLDLPSMDIDWVGDYPNGEVWSGKAIRGEHGLILRNKSGMTAAAIVEEVTVSTAFGHNHRQETASKTLWTADGPRVVHAIGPGCLCRIDGAVPAKKSRNNWQQGEAIVYHDNERVLDVNLISINEGRTFMGSKEIVARDRVEELRETTRSPVDNEPWLF